ncbi:MAG: AraC family transcriptional regulator [Spirochaetes bacterium]|nr:AraC family transcriptional regulator [Spirochaetota bacterium]
MNIFEIARIINIAGIIHGIILSIAIYHKRKTGGKSLSFFALYIFIYSAGNLSNILSHHFFAAYSWHPFLSIPFYSALGVAFYFYVKSYLGFADRIKPVFHFFAFGVVGLFFLMQLLPEQYRLNTILVEVTISASIGIQIFAYLFFSLKEVYAYYRNNYELNSLQAKFRLLWVVFFISVSMLSWIISMAIESMIAHEDAWDFFWIMISVIVYASGYIGIKQPEILEYIESVRKKKYEKTAIPHEKVLMYEKELEEAVSRQFFLDPDISLSSLSKEIGIHSYQLSQIINTKGMNFYEYVNRLRVEYAKRIIAANPDSVNITRIAYDSGFNSISAFNSAFRKFSGITPSEFMKKSIKERRAAD